MAGNFWRFLLARKKFWLMPMIVVVLLIGAAFVLQQAVPTPFSYGRY